MLRLMPASSIRSIPACAGEPRDLPFDYLMHEVYPRVCGEPPGPVPGAAVHRVYPRVCGGTGPGTAGPPCWWGLSPRVRGNRTHL